MRLISSDLNSLKLEIAAEFDRRDPDKTPQRVFSRPTADLPDPALYPNCVAFDETLGVLVTSDGSAWV